MFVVNLRWDKGDWTDDTDQVRVVTNYPISSSFNPVTDASDFVDAD